MMNLTRLTAPSRPTGRLTTVHAPVLEIVPVWHFLKSDPSTLEITYRDAETGELVHHAVVTPARGGCVVVEGKAQTYVPIMARAQKTKIAIEFACPACSTTHSSLFLFSAGPDGQTLKPGPRCRRCANLVHGSQALLCGRYSRSMLSAWLESLGAQEEVAR
jgi:hypothetical protein